jgi:deoxyhypusine synthase
LSHSHAHHEPHRGAERKTGYRQELADGFCDGLVPTESIDLAKARGFSDLLAQMSRTAFGGRRLGEAADVLEAMIRDEDCLVVGTFSGAMTVAKQGLILCDMIEQGMLQAVVTTGALMTHGLVNSVGMQHFKYDPSMDDTVLYGKGYNRVYDTLELEGNLDDTELIVREVLAALPEGAELSSSLICREIGRHLSENVPGRGILKSAYEAGVPVYVPAAQGLRSVPRPRGLHRAHPGRAAARHLHRRRRRAAQLGAAGRAVP